ncbi:MAG TPA: DedA family protein [Deltaproteobacteria bacterium]|nr:DedA family protein [Deltaproteobacteria bacterium]
MLKRLYDWVLGWAHTPYGTWALFILAFTESSFFPIPPDVLLIALAISIPARAFLYAGLCSLGSVTGGLFGYAIGLYFMEAVGYNIIDFYGFQDKYEQIQALYRDYDAWAVALAGFTPLPYKVFTISAGAFDIDFTVFLIASALSRSARFFLVAAVIYRFGEPIRGFIERYFNLLTAAFAAALVAGFALVRLLAR